MARPPRRQRIDRAPGMPGDPREVAAARWRALGQASTDPRLNDLDVRAFTFVLAERMNSTTGLTYLSGKRLAADLKIAERSAFRVLKRLEAAMYLAGYRMPGRSTVYSIVWKRFSGTPMTEESQVLVPVAAAATDVTVESHASDSPVLGGRTRESHIPTPGYLPSTTPPDARESAKADDGEAVEDRHAAADAAARRIGHPASQEPASQERTAFQIECDFFWSRCGARIWWSSDTLAPPDAEADPDFAQLVYAYQRNAKGWTIRETGGVRIMVRPTDALPSASAITKFARAILEGDDWAIELGMELIRMLDLEAEVQAEEEARRLAAFRANKDQPDFEALAALDDPDVDRRLAAHVRAASLMAAWPQPQCDDAPLTKGGADVGKCDPRRTAA